MISISKQAVAKGATYIFIETVTTMVSGYLFWVVISKLVAPEVIGVSSIVVSLGSIFSVIASIGVPIGIQRFLGMTFAEKNLSNTRTYMQASLVLSFIGIIISASFILIAYDWLYSIYRIDIVLVPVTASLIASSAIMTLFRSVIIASLRSKNIASNSFDFFNSQGSVRHRLSYIGNWCTRSNCCLYVLSHIDISLTDDRDNSNYQVDRRSSR